MRAMTKWTILASVALGAGACGGGGPSLDDFLGMHQVASHRENHGGGQYVPCDNPGDEIPEQSAAYRPYFAIVDEPAVEDENFVKFQTCTGSDAGSCVDTQIIMEYGDGQLEYLTQRFETSTGCDLYAGRSSAIIEEDGSVRVVDRTWDARDVTGDCTAAAAAALRDTAECRDVIYWRSTPEE
jgi:hypothetical protein